MVKRFLEAMACHAVKFIVGMPLKAILIGAASLATIFLSGIIILKIGTEPPPNNPSEDISATWNATVHRLGIEPVYPPQEDMAVGDIYLLMTQNSGGSPLPLPLQGRS